MSNHLSGRRRWTIAVLTAGALALTGCSAGSIRGGGDEGGDDTLTWLIDNGAGTLATAEGLADGFEASHEGVTVKIETRPGGTEGDNVVKTRLSTGDMPDVFIYNTGSLLQAIDPAKNLVPLDDSVDTATLEDSFLTTVKSGDDYYGTPFGTALAGGVLYNRKVYDKLGLKVPTTWDEFMANNAKIKAAGIAPVIQTYQTDTWTSQLFVLGDYHNVESAEPGWADKYTKNEVTYSQEPAVEGFKHLQEVHDAGFMNKDFGSAKLSDGIDMLAAGKGAQYPILTTVLVDLTQAHPDQVKDIGFFALPGDDAASNGMTVWPGLAAVYIPKSTEGAKLELAKEFQAYVATTEACEAQTKGQAPSGPYLVKGCTLPTDVPPAVKDLQRYFEEDKATPALEFLSPVKGPALEQICVEVGSGIKSAEEAAALYDEDVKKQAQQLNLPGWS
jgi:raffinose/stachyose/melibiose transport system substrate-binding protein